MWFLEIDVFIALIVRYSYFILINYIVKQVISIYEYPVNEYCTGK